MAANSNGTATLFDFVPRGVVPLPFSRERPAPRIVPPAPPKELAGQHLPINDLYDRFRYVLVISRVDHPDHAERSAFLLQHHPETMWAYCETPSLTVYGFRNYNVGLQFKDAFIRQKPSGNVG
jgi:hypothetical protein